MFTGNRPIALFLFFFRSILITLIIISTFFVISISYNEIRNWWASYPYYGLLLFLPGVIILMRGLYKTIHKKHEEFLHTRTNLPVPTK